MRLKNEKKASAALSRFFSAFLPRAFGDPALWIRKVLGVNLYGSQKRVVRAVRNNDRVAVKSGHGVGKGFVSACIAAWWVGVRHGLVLVTAPTWAQVTNVWFATLRGILRSSVIAFLRKAEAEILSDRWMLGPAWGVLGVASDRPDNIQGYHAANMLLIADEAAGIPDDIFEAFEGSQVSRGVGGAKVLLLGNPTRRDSYFGRAFDAEDARVDVRRDSGHASRGRARKHSWKTITISCLDSPNVTGEMLIPGVVGQDWIKEREEDWGRNSNAFRVRVLGEFPIEGAVDRLIPEHVLLAAMRPSMGGDAGEARLPDNSPAVQGLDVARFGDDRSVSVIVRGGVVVDAAARQNMSTIETARWAGARAETHGVVRTVVDETGLGGGVFDNLREMRLDVAGVNFASAPQNRARWGDLRTELAAALGEALRSGKLVLPQHLPAELFDEIRQLRYEITRAGAVILESKQSVKERLGRSPDFADALMLAWHGASGLRQRSPADIARAALENALANFTHKPEGGVF